MLKLRIAGKIIHTQSLELDTTFTLTEAADGVPFLAGGAGGGGGASSNVLGKLHTDPIANLSMYMATPDQTIAGASNTGAGTGFIDYTTFASDGATWSATRKRPPLRITAKQILLRTKNDNGSGNLGIDGLYIDETGRVGLGTLSFSAGVVPVLGGAAIGVTVQGAGNADFSGTLSANTAIAWGLNYLNTLAQADVGLPMRSGFYTATSGALNTPTVGNYNVLTSRYNGNLVNIQMQFAAPQANSGELYFRNINGGSLAAVTKATSPWFKIGMLDSTTGQVLAPQGVLLGINEFGVKFVVAGASITAGQLVYIDSVTGTIKVAFADSVNLPPALFIAADSVAANALLRIVPLQGLFVNTSGWTLGTKVYLGPSSGAQLLSVATVLSGQTVMYLGSIVKTTTGGAQAIAYSPVFMYINS